MYGPTWSLVFSFSDSELPELERDVGSSAEDDDGTGRLRHQVREHPEVGHLDVQVTFKTPRPPQSGPLITIDCVLLFVT